jgi:hypothetical protein
MLAPLTIRREHIRRQLEEAERYRANPILYIFNPQIRVSFLFRFITMPTIVHTETNELRIIVTIQLQLGDLSVHIVAYCCYPINRPVYALQRRSDL